MNTGTILDSALDAWQVAFQDGDDRPAADFCSDHPDLLPELERQVAALRNMLRVVRVASPASDDTRPDPVDAGNTATGERAAAAALPAGETGPPGFVLERELGRGGMGVVYLAHQQGLNRPVALKMVLGTAPPSAVIRFLAEAESVAAVRHPNVVEVYQFGEHDGRPFLVLEFCPGGDLTTTKAGKTDPRQAAEWMAAVAEGVNAAHAAGVVHRDLKPHNVLLAADGTPKVTDFGLAKKGVGADLTGSEAVMGTPAYMSPEQAGGGTKFVGPESDVWALGVMLYELLAGHKPFAGPSNMDFLVQILGRKFAPLRSVCSDVPRDLELIVSKCLRQEPRERYANAGELAADLRNWLDGKPISARPMGSIEAARKWVRRNKAVAALVALMTALAVTLPALVVWDRSRTELARRDMDQANAAKRAAEELAAQREVFLLLGALQKRGQERPTGWTADNRADIRRAVPLTADPTLRDTLRTETARLALAYDVRPLPAWTSPVVAACLAVSPDGNTVAVGEYAAQAVGFLPSRVVLLDARSGQVTRTLTTESRPAKDGRGKVAKEGIRSLAFAADGRHLFAGTRASYLSRFDLTRPGGVAVASWQGLEGSLEILHVAPDGRTVYASDRKSMAAWDADTGKPLGKMPQPDICSILTSPHRPELLAGHSFQNLHRLQPRTLRPEGDFGVPATSETGWSHAEFLPGGKAVVGTAERAAVCEPTSNTPHRLPLVDPTLRLATHARFVSGIACHPRLPVVATVCDGADVREVKVWHAGSGVLIGRLDVPPGGSVRAAWAGADGNTLLLTSREGIHRWELVPPATETTSTVSGTEVVDAAVAADGTVLTLDDDDIRRSLRVWADPPVGPTRRFAVDREAIAGWTSNSGTLIALGKNLGIVQCSDSRCHLFRHGPEGATILHSARFASRPCVSSDGRTVWHIGSSTESDEPGVTARAADTFAARGAWDGGNAKLLTGFGSIDRLAGGREQAVAGGNSGDLTVLDSTARRLGTAVRGTLDNVLGIAVADDDSAAVAGFQSGEVRVVDLTATEYRQVPLKIGHPGGVTAVGLGRRGTELVTGGRDGTVRLWRRAGGRGSTTYEPVVTIAGLPAHPIKLQYLRDSDTLLVLLRGEHVVRFWNLASLLQQAADVGLDP